MWRWGSGHDARSMGPTVYAARGTHRPPVQDLFSNGWILLVRLRSNAFEHGSLPAGATVAVTAGSNQDSAVACCHSMSHFCRGQRLRHRQTTNTNKRTKLVGAIPVACGRPLPDKKKAWEPKGALPANIEPV